MAILATFKLNTARNPQANDAGSSKQPFAVCVPIEIDTTITAEAQNPVIPFLFTSPSSAFFVSNKKQTVNITYSITGTCSNPDPALKNISFRQSQETAELNTLYVQRTVGESFDISGSFDIDLEAYNANTSPASTIGLVCSTRRGDGTTEFWDFSNIEITVSSVDTDFIESDDPTFTSDGNNTCGELDIVVGGLTGTAPYTVTGDFSGTFNSSPIVLRGNRGGIYNFKITDSLGAFKDFRVQIPLNNINQAIQEPIFFIQQKTGRTTVYLTQANLPNIYNWAIAVSGFPVSQSDYQSSPVFVIEGLTGDFDAYVKDVYGCTRMVSFNIPPLDEGVEPFIQVSEFSTVKFEKQITEGQCDRQTNLENTINRLHKFSRYTSPSCVYHRFKNCDIPKIQIWSSYQDHIVRVFDKKGQKVGTDIIPTLQIQNIDLFQRWDCQLIKTSDGYVGLFFTNGGVYDESDNLIENYSLNGGLPSEQWVLEGSVIGVNSLNTGFFATEITDLTTDSGFYGNIIKTNQTWDFPDNIDKSAQIDVRFNDFNYNVFEFDIPLTGLDGFYYCEILTNDTRFEQVILSSEFFNVAEDWDNCLLIKWKNNGINYETNFNTGIEYFARLQGNIEILANDDGEETTYQTDLLAGIVETYKFKTGRVLFLDLLPDFAYRQMKAATKNDFFQIDGTEFTTAGESLEFSIVGADGGAVNLYKIKINIWNKNYNFNNINTNLAAFDKNSGVIVDSKTGGAISYTP